MHSVLLIVEMPQLENWNSPANHPVVTRWEAFTQKQHILVLKHKGIVELLGQGCVLVNLKRGAEAFSHALQVAVESGFPYRMLFIDEEQNKQWVQSEPAT